jgi:hypothetical protein
MSSRDQPTAAAGLPITSVNLPFLGSRSSPYGTFQYLLQEVDESGATFVVPSWVVRREHFRVGDMVNLHFPFRTEDGWHRQQAEIASVTPDAERTGQICRTRFQDHQPLHHPMYASLETGTIAFRTTAGEAANPDELLVQILRDCLLQKRGVAVYFKHLVPLFSRITLFPREDYGSLRRLVLEDVRQRIEANIASFQAWFDQAEAGKLTVATLSRDLDLETLRTAVEGEIENELLETTFATNAIRPYTDAIRLLDEKLYLNHNMLVLLYAQAL